MKRRAIGTMVRSTCVAFILGWALSARAQLWTPAELGSDLALWLDATDTNTLFDATSGGNVVADNGAVARWEDKSGNGRHATQDTAANRPTYKAASFNGSWPTLDWGTASNSNRLFKAEAGANWQETFVVAHWTAGGSTFPTYNGIFTGSDTSGTGGGIGLIGSQSSANLYTGNKWWSAAHLNGAATSTTVGFPTVTSPFIVRFHADSAISVNGFTVGTDRNGASDPPRGWRGQISEVVSVSAPLTTIQRQHVEGYLAHKWGLGANLPSDHPYKGVGVSDPVTGSTQFTGTNQVAVTFDVSFQGYTHYKLTETDVEPTGGWLDYDPQTPPETSYTFDAPTPETPLTLFVWFKDVSASLPTFRVSAATIFYTQVEPTVIVHATRDYATYDGTPFMISGADLNNGSSGGTVTIGTTEYPMTVYQLLISVGAGAPADTLSLAVGTYTVTLTVMNEAGNTATAPSPCEVTITDIAKSETTADVTWEGRSGSLNSEWFRGQNWLGNQPPVTNSAAIALFTAPGQGTTQITESRTLGTLRVRNYNEGPATNITHGFDLNGHNLNVSNLHVAHRHEGTHNTLSINLGDVECMISNGTFEVSTDITVATMSKWLNVPSSLSGNLVFDNVDLVVTNLPSVTVAGRGGTSRRVEGTLDLTKARLIGGLFKVGTLYVAAQGDTTTGRILFSEDTGLQDFVVTQAFEMGCEGGNGRIGLPDTFLLPSGVNVMLGVSKNSRALFRMGRISGRTGVSASGSLIATSGGDFTAYLSTMTIAERGSSAWGSNGRGTLDIRAMNRVMIDANAIHIGLRSWYGDTTANFDATGEVYLPTGIVQTATLTVGENSATEIGNGRVAGLLDLAGTTVSVTNALRIGTGTAQSGWLGRVVTTVKDFPAGLDIGVGATFDVGDRGRIEIVFTELPSVPNQGLYGLRWRGGDVDTLQALATAGKLTWDDTAVNGKVEIYEFKGDAYVGIPLPLGTMIIIQ